jgi:putative ABC transport system permease protein
MKLSERLQSAAEGVYVAFDSVMANKGRAGLTILGVAVGVLVVVLMSSAINGINQSVSKEFESAGPTSFFISRFPIFMGNCDGPEDCKFLRNPPLTIGDAQAVSALDGIQGVIAQVNANASVRFREQSISRASIEGNTANWIDAAGGDVYPGRSFIPTENTNASRVVIVNENMATKLFGELDPIGKTISMSGKPFEVIGVYHESANFLSGGDDAKAIVPFETARRDLKANVEWLNLSVRPRAGVPRDQAVDDVTATLRARRRLRPATESTFAIITQDMLFETWGKITGTFFLVMLVLASVGLIVGGVGVIAIMMISVTERTREIGVRKALGATRGAILFQFLVEAVMLTGVGSVIGLVVGWLLTWVIRANTPVAASVPMGAVVAALVGSAITGVAFGMYPAARASRLDPVEALRYE